VAAWVGLTGILILAGFGAVHSSAVEAFDRHITSTVVAHRTPALNSVMRALTWLGSWVALVATGVVVLALAVRRNLAWLSVGLVLVAWAGEVVAVSLAKHVVRRQRPPTELWLYPAHGWSWPSGHAATAALTFAVLAIVLTRSLHHRLAKVATWSAAVVVVAGVGFSRIELGVHWTTDVLASLAFVTGWLVVIFAVFAKDLRAAESTLRIAQPTTSEVA